MYEATILAWAVPVSLVLIGLVFFVLDRHIRGSLWWGVAYSTAALGFASTNVPVGEFKIAKAILEDTLFLFALMAMARGIALRFRRATHDIAVSGFIALVALAAGIALAVYNSVPAEIFIIQGGCAALLVLAAWQMRGHFAHTINRVLCGLCLALAASLMLQNVVYLAQPAPELTIDGWRQSDWAFAFQAGSAAFGLLFAFTALIAISLDTIEKLHLTATTDLLSGVLNRRGFETAADAMLRSTREPATVILLDLDHFKRVNDGFGHAAGDAVIAGLGRLLSKAVGECGPVGRIGGEEFAVLLAATRLDEAIPAAEALREAIRQTEWGGKLAGLSLTASMGLAEIEPGETLQDAILKADERLYLAKAAGRDRVVAEDKPKLQIVEIVA